MGPRVTQKSIAEHCGVSTATVSYALRNSSRIPSVTRDRILAAAKDLGYQPDPGLASLASRRSTRGNVPLTSSVAIVHPKAKDSRPSQLFEYHSRHFKKRMSELGCLVTDFHIDNDRYRPERLAQILRTRGIKGILLGWGQWPESMKRFPWNEFAVISTVRTDLASSIDKVSMNHFHALDDIFQHLEGSSYKRYGMILHDDCPNYTVKHILGAYYANLYERPNLVGIEPFRYHLDEEPDRLKQWYERQKPDLIISHRIIDLNYFARAGINIPDETGLVILEIDEESSVDFSGVYSGAEMGRTIAVSLARKIRNEEINATRSNGKLTFVNGVLHEGSTCRKGGPR